MRNSYEPWGRNPIDTPKKPAPPPERETHFSFSEDFRELEASLSMSFHEGMEAYRQTRNRPHHKGFPGGHLQESIHDNLQDEAQWNEMAHLVADHVLTYLQTKQAPIHQEMETLRREADDYYRDNRAMALQIQRLLEEKEQLQNALGMCQLELSRYRPLIGNLHLKV